MDAIVFAGNHEEYFNWMHYNTCTDARYVEEPSDIKNLQNFAFFEVGTYGTNKAWQYMRELYGYTPEERVAMHKDIKKFAMDNYAYKRGIELVPFYKYVINCTCGYSINQSFAISSMNEAIPLPRPKTVNHTVSMTRVASKEHIIIGSVGQCNNCERIYYSTSVVSDDVVNKSAMISQIAAGTNLSFKDVDSMYQTLGSLVDTERLTKLNLCGLMDPIKLASLMNAYTGLSTLKPFKIYPISRFARWLMKWRWLWHTKQK